MTYYAKNLTIAVSSVSDISKDLLQIVSAYSVMTQDFLTYSNVVQSMLVAFGWINLLLGSSIRFIIYKYIYDQYKMKDLTSINVFTLFLCIVQHFNIIMYEIDVTMMFVHGNNYQQITEKSYCVFRRLMPTFEVFCTTTGGLGIAIYRILLIKKPFFAQETVGLKLLLGIMLTCVISLSTFLTVFLNYIESQQLVNETCMLALKKDTLQILDDFEESSGNPRIYSTSIKLSLCIASLMICIATVELLIYAIFFHHLYKHDNTPTLRRLIGHGAIDKRNKRNALTFFSQVCSFLFEIGFTISLIIFFKFATSGSSISIAVIIIRRLYFTLIGFIQVVTSENLTFTIFLTLLEQNAAVRKEQ